MSWWFPKNIWNSVCISLKLTCCISCASLFGLCPCFALDFCVPLLYNVCFLSWSFCWYPGLVWISFYPSRAPDAAEFRLHYASYTVCCSVSWYDWVNPCSLKAYFKTWLNYVLLFSDFIYVNRTYSFSLLRVNVDMRKVPNYYCSLGWWNLKP